VRFIGQRVVDLESGKLIQSFPFDRTQEAAEAGVWFEHVYPYDITDPARIAGRLLELANRCAKKGAFFLGACIDGSCVIMPACLSKPDWDINPSERYEHYARATDGKGQFATQAIIFIDSGDRRYEDSEQLGFRDRYHLAGQLAIDMGPGGWYAEKIDTAFDADGKPCLRATTVADSEGRPFELTGPDSVLLNR